MDFEWILDNGLVLDFINVDAELCDLAKLSRSCCHSVKKYKQRRTHSEETRKEIRTYFEEKRTVDRDHRPDLLLGLIKRPRTRVWLPETLSLLDFAKVCSHTSFRAIKNGLCEVCHGEHAPQTKRKAYYLMNFRMFAHEDCARTYFRERTFDMVELTPLQRFTLTQSRFLRMRTVQLLIRRMKQLDKWYAKDLHEVYYSLEELYCFGLTKERMSHKALYQLCNYDEKNMDKSPREDLRKRKAIIEDVWQKYPTKHELCKRRRVLNNVLYRSS